MQFPGRILPVVLLALAGVNPSAADEERRFRIGPDYSDAPEVHRKPDVPRGAVHEFTMDSKDSRIYPGVAKGRRGEVPYQRKVFVYVPSQHEKGEAAPFIVAQDGNWYREILPTVLDNMIHEKRLPAIVAVMVDSGGGDGPGSQRGLEYDTVSDTYVTFIEKEVLPRVEKECGLKLTDDPEGRMTMGGSSGAAAAFTMAWFEPDLYRKVLSWSGTYVNLQSPPNRRTPHGAWEYHENLIRRSAPKPLRIWLHVSENDNGKDRDERSMMNWVLANERMADVLEKRGYDFRYVFAENAGHVDGKVTRQTLPGALEWLWQGYRVE